MVGEKGRNKLRKTWVERHDFSYVRLQETLTSYVDVPWFLTNKLGKYVGNPGWNSMAYVRPIRKHKPTEKMEHDNQNSQLRPSKRQ